MPKFSGSADLGDQKRSLKIAVGLTAILATLLFVGYFFLGPELTKFISEHLSPGVGLKSSAVISFVLTFTVFVVFAVFAGDGLIGELQFMISGFFAFFFVIWLLVAWVF